MRLGTFSSETKRTGSVRSSDRAKNGVRNVERLVIADDEIVRVLVHLELLRRAVIQVADFQYLLQVLHSAGHADVAEGVAEKNDVRPIGDRLKVRRVVDFVFVLVERMDQFVAEGHEVTVVIVSNEVGNDVGGRVVVLELGDFLFEEELNDVPCNAFRVREKSEWIPNAPRPAEKTRMGVVVASRSTMKSRTPALSSIFD